MTAPAKSPTDQGYPPAAADAAARCSYELTFDRAREPRLIWPGFLGGDPIPSSSGWEHDAASGDWEGPAEDVPSSGDPAAWVDHYASLAVGECVHEALEWFRVDGGRWLDPHGPGEGRVYEAVRAFCARLAEIRAEVAARG